MYKYLILCKNMIWPYLAKFPFPILQFLAVSIDDLLHRNNEWMDVSHQWKTHCIPVAEFLAISINNFIGVIMNGCFMPVKYTWSSGIVCLSVSVVGLAGCLCFSSLSHQACVQQLVCRTCVVYANWMNSQVDHRWAGNRCGPSHTIIMRHYYYLKFAL